MQGGHPPPQPSSTVIPSRRIPVLAAILIFLGLGQGAQAQETPGADPVVAAALASLTQEERGSDLKTMRALRRYLYRRLPLAANGDYWVTDPPVREAASLESALKLFETAEKGVWCQAAAVLLARLYEAAGYRAWVTSYGDPATLTHTVTLVEAGGRIYLQDAYFNLDYVDSGGAPLPYLQVLRHLARGRPPRVRQDLDFRLGIFPHPRVAKEWTAPGLHDDIVCVNDKPPYLCSVALSEARFEQVFYIRDQVHGFLAKQGLPRRFDYLMLFPLWTSQSAAPLKTEATMALHKRIEAAAGRHQATPGFGTSGFVTP